MDKRELLSTFCSAENAAADRASHSDPHADRCRRCADRNDPPGTAGRRQADRVGYPAKRGLLLAVAGRPATDRQPRGDDDHRRLPGNDHGSSTRSLAPGPTRLRRFAGPMAISPSAAPLWPSPINRGTPAANGSSENGEKSGRSRSEENHDLVPLLDASQCGLPRTWHRCPSQPGTLKFNNTGR